MRSPRFSVQAVVLGLVASLIGAQSQAALITWSGLSLAGSGTTRISTSGVLVEAHNVGDASAIVAGGVPFDASDVNTLGGVFSGADTTALTGNAPFDSVLNSASFATSPTSYLIDGLVNGTKYLVQFFVADTRTVSSANLRTVTYSDGTTSVTSGPVGAGFVFNGTFTAIGTTQSVAISGTAPFGDAFAYMNAWQLRDVTNVAQVPEPATLCLWAGLGLVVASGAYKRRGTKAVR